MRSTGATVAIAGRRREMAVVARLVGAAGAGAGGALLITGEAGIGKSRLVTETIALARSAGLAVLTGRAVPGAERYRVAAPTEPLPRPCSVTSGTPGSSPTPRSCVPSAPRSTGSRRAG